MLFLFDLGHFPLTSLLVHLRTPWIGILATRTLTCLSLILVLPPNMSAYSSEIPLICIVNGLTLGQLNSHRCHTGFLNLTECYFYCHFTSIWSQTLLFLNSIFLNSQKSRFWVFFASCSCLILKPSLLFNGSCPFSAHWILLYKDSNIFWVWVILKLFYDFYCINKVAVGLGLSPSSPDMSIYLKVPCVRWGHLSLWQEKHRKQNNTWKGALHF